MRTHNWDWASVAQSVNQLNKCTFSLTFNQLSPLLSLPHFCFLGSPPDKLLARKSLLKLCLGGSQLRKLPINICCYESHGKTFLFPRKLMLEPKFKLHLFLSHLIFFNWKIHKLINIASFCTHLGSHRKCWKLVEMILLFLSWHFSLSLGGGAGQLAWCTRHSGTQCYLPISPEVAFFFFK